MTQTPERRARNTAWARRRREGRLQVARRTAARWPKRWGVHPCGGPLRVTTDGDGRTLIVCAWCERHDRGLCVECPRRIVGRAKRCPACQRTERNRAAARHRATHHEAVCARQRELYARPAVRRKHNTYKRAWRKLNPEKVRAQKRREHLRQPKRILRYMARYRARHREHYRRMQLARYYRLHPRRPDPRCVECGAPIPWEGRGHPPKRCDGCVPLCVLRLREAGRARRAATAPPVPPRPRPLRPPPTTYILGDGRHRCLGRGCRTVLEGRTKKCSACKARDREDAVAVLASVSRTSTRTHSTEESSWR